MALASLTATIPAQAIAQAACSVADMVEFPSVYYEDFGTGSGRTMNNDVLNHTFQPTGGIQDDWYAVGRSADLSGAYMQTLGGVDADGETEGRYLGINMRGKNEPGNSWQGEFYRQNNISMVPSGLPSGASLGGFRFSTALVGTCAGCEDVPNFTLIIEDSSNGSQLASDTSSGIGVANDDVWRTATLDVVPAPASATAANLVLFNSQPEGDNGNDVGVDNISFVPLVCYSPVLDFTKTEVLITNVVGDPDAVEAGDVIRYTFTAVNSGSATAYNVAVTENSFNGLGAIPVPVVFSGAADLDGGNGTNTDVAVGATLVYRADYVITQGDIDAGGIINNLADIAYEDLAGNPFSDTSDDDDVTSGDQPTSTPVPVPAVDDASSGNAQGDTVNITLTNNDGVAAIDSTVSLIPPSGAIGVVTDGNGDIISFTVPNQGAWSYTDGSGILQFVPLAGFAGNPTPIGYTVKAPNGANSNSASVTISYVPSVPEIELVKSVSSVADTSGNGIFGDAGDTVNYTFTAENTGNTALAGITVSDTDLAALSGAFTLNQPAAGFDGDLAAGEGPVTVATATYVLHVSDVAARGVTNSADVTSTAVATSAGGDPVPGAPLLGFGPIVDDSDAGSEASFDTQDGSTTPISNPAGTGGPDDPTVLNISNVVALDDSGTATSGTSSTPVANVTTEGTPDTVNGVA
ncbi:DUF7507 domain-containing protein, partial [Yoonia tamlensis]|uniref:DUF7507 domain-containing protein n=1 Tax=Yoonia tamlensis TaxID=390270 RepID=UPI004055E037